MTLCINKYCIAKLVHICEKQKGKFKEVKTHDFFVQADHLPSVNAETVATIKPSNEAVAALIALGYKPLDAEKMVKKVSKPELSSEQLIREALKAAL